MAEDKIEKSEKSNSDSDLAKDIWKKLDLSATESSRAKIIIAASYLDDLLGRLLNKKMLLPATSREDSLFDANRPLYNFGPKIDLAYRLGLVSGELSGVLHMVRRMRDDCAHSHDEIDFDDEALRDRIDNLHHRLDKKLIASDKTAEQKFKRIFLNCALVLTLKIQQVSSVGEMSRELIFNEAQ